MEWGSDRIDPPIRGLRLLILSEDEDGVVAAEAEGLGKAGPDESPFDKIRIHIYAQLYFQRRLSHGTGDDLFGCGNRD